MSRNKSNAITVPAFKLQMQKGGTRVSLVRNAKGEMRLYVAGETIWVTKEDLRHVHDLLSIATHLQEYDPLTLGDTQ